MFNGILLDSVGSNVGLACYVSTPEHATLHCYKCISSFFRIQQQAIEIWIIKSRKQSI